MLKRSTTHAATLLVSLGVALTACSNAPEANDVEWGNLPEGTIEYVSQAVEADNCVPVRNSYAYVSIFESDKQTPSAAYTFLSDVMDRMNCDQLSVDEQLDELLNPQISMNSLDGLLGTDDNPLWSGPGCIGVLRVLDLMRAPDPRDNFETTLAKTILATDAVLRALPSSVTKTGTKEPSQSEDVAMSIATAFSQLGDALLDDGLDRDAALKSALDDLSWLQTQMSVACIAEYDDGPSPSRGVMP